MEWKPVCLTWNEPEKDGQPVVSEVGARPPGVNIMPMMSLAYDLDMWDKWAELMVHDRWELPPRQFAVGCAFLRAQGRGNTIVDVTGLEAAQSAVGEWVVQSKLPHKGQSRSSHYEGDGFVIVRHEDTEKVVTALRTIITKIRVVAG